MELKAAKESREISEKNQQNWIAAEIQKVSRTIDDAVASGETSVYHYEHLSETTIQILKDYGYAINFVTNKNETD